MENWTQEYGFSAKEWDACLKVLNQLKENPLHNPDNKTFGALVTKVHKQAKKALKHIEVETEERKRIFFNAHLVPKFIGKGHIIRR